MCYAGLPDSRSCPRRPPALPRPLPGPRCNVSPFLHVAACEPSAVPSFVSLPPPAGPFWDSSRSSRPAPRGLRLIRQLPPLPGARTQSAAPPRPAPTPPPSGAGRLPLHPGIDSSRPDSGTMVMAEGTAVLRRNRPGTKAQVLYLHLFYRGTLGGDAGRPGEEGWAEAVGWRVGVRVPGLLFRSRSPWVWLRRRWRIARPAES